MAWGWRILTRAAASSIASGKPSSRRQISTIAEALSSVNSKPTLASAARCANSATAPNWYSSSSGGRRGPLGRPRVGTGNSRSPRTRSEERLVMRNLRRGATAINSATNDAALMTCSKLSRISKSCLSRSPSCRLAATPRPAISRTPNVSAMTSGTWVGSLTDSGTKKAPCSNSSTTSAAICSASRVLPIPPGPVSVTSRVSTRRSSCRPCSSSRSRPISAVGCAGRLFGRASSVFSGGNSLGSPGTINWYSRSGLIRSLSRRSPMSRSSPGMSGQPASRSEAARDSRTWLPWPAERRREARLRAGPK